MPASRSAKEDGPYRATINGAEGTSWLILGYHVEITACQLDMTEMGNAGISQISRHGQRIGIRALHLSAAISSPPGALPIIKPATQRPEHLERKIELHQTVDFAVQLLVEEAYTLG
ncbi:hypothetical protein ASD32_12625 [Rhizobium sp. Root483D2]|nr:hypothetical protein ASD32_12625 [Rhizobium sp. Root483D2]